MINENQYRRALSLIEKHTDLVTWLGKIEYKSETQPSHLMVRSALVGAERGLMRELSSILRLDLSLIPIDLLEI